MPTTFTVKLIFCLPATDTSLVPLWILPTLLFYYFPLTSFSHGETQKNLPVLIFFLFLFFPYKDFACSLLLFWFLPTSKSHTNKLSQCILQQSQFPCLKGMVVLDSGMLEPDHTNFMDVFPTQQSVKSL